MSADLSPLIQALADRAENLCFQLIPSGRIEAGEFTASGGDTGFGAIGVVLKGAKRGRVGFWAGRPDDTTKDGGDLLHLIMATQQLRMRDAILWAQSWLGGAAVTLKEAPPRAEREQKEQQLGAWKREKALKLFNDAQPMNAAHSVNVADHYLRQRGIYFSHDRHLSGDIRFAPRVEHWRSATKASDGRRQPGPSFPAIVCGIRNAAGDLAAVHVTFLARDGSGKAPVDSPKLMMGDVKGGTICVQAGAPGAPRVLLEGLEDGLTAMMACDPDWQIHAVTSLANLRHAPIPADCAGIVICPDNDWDNPAATQAFERAYWALREHGKPIKILRATGGAKDLNDMVKPRGNA